MSKNQNETGKLAAIPNESTSIAHLETMSEAVFECLLQSMEKRDKELGRVSPTVNLQCDARYWKFVNIVRAQLGREPNGSEPNGSSAARGSGPSSADRERTPTKSAHNSSCAPSSSRDRGNMDKRKSKAGYVILETKDDDMEVIDLLDNSEEIVPSNPAHANETSQQKRIPRLFSDEDETMVLDPSPCSQLPEKQLSQSDARATTAGKRKAVQPNQSPKRRRTKKPPKEVRGDRYRSAPAKWILERMQRHTQRLCLVRFESRGEDGMVLDVMGTNGNIYKVVIGLHPTCTCMDFTGRAQKGKNGPCKHLIFAFLRVFKLEREDPSWWQTRLVPSELKDLLEKRPAHLGDGVMAEERVQRQFAAMTAQSSSGRRPLEGDCPVCYEDLLEADGARPEDVTTFCKHCGNNFHKVCLDKWIQAQTENPTCPMCRRTLQTNEKEKEEGYVNLAAYSSAHETQLTLAEMYRDTHQYIGTGGRGRGRGRRRGRGR